MSEEREHGLEDIARRDGFNYGLLKDDRPDARGLKIEYRTLKLKDGREWMAENFRFFISQDDSVLWYPFYGSPNAEEDKGWGLFYNWKSIQRVLPAGWRLPTIEEWNNLVQSYGGPSSAYDALLIGGSSGMDLQLLSWRGGHTYTKSEQLGKEGLFWSSSEGDDNRVAAVIKLEKSANSIKVEYHPKYIFYTVRLIKA